MHEINLYAAFSHSARAMAASWRPHIGTDAHIRGPHSEEEQAGLQCSYRAAIGAAPARLAGPRRLLLRRLLVARGTWRSKPTRGCMSSSSAVQARLQDFGHVPSDLGHVPSDLGHVRSDLGHVRSDLGHVRSHNFVRSAVLKLYQRLKPSSDSRDRPFRCPPRPS